VRTKVTQPACKVWRVLRIGACLAPKVGLVLCRFFRVRKLLKTQSHANYKNYHLEESLYDLLYSPSSRLSLAIRLLSCDASRSSAAILNLIAAQDREAGRIVLGLEPELFEGKIPSAPVRVSGSCVSVFQRSTLTLGQMADAIVYFGAEAGLAPKAKPGR
jgi:hypothetical protein